MRQKPPKILTQDEETSENESEKDDSEEEEEDEDSEQEEESVEESSAGEGSDKESDDSDEESEHTTGKEKKRLPRKSDTDEGRTLFIRYYLTDYFYLFSACAYISTGFKLSMKTHVQNILCAFTR